MNDTIAAIATPLGNGAVSIVRISGVESLNIIAKLFVAYKLDDISKAEPNKMYLGTLQSETISDRCLFVYFKAPMSYTGEDVVELQLHGGRRITEEVLSCVLSYGARLADKGEFTRRAFLNGKISISQAEGIQAMISEESLSMVNSAYSLAMGAMSKTIESICGEIIEADAYLEVLLDSEAFEDEESSKLLCGNKINKALGMITDLIANYKKTRLLSNGIKVSIVGRTNMGKSSILNCLCNYERAIVTDIAGTTRDIINEKIEYKGINLEIIDTAGVRDSSDVIETIGIERAINEAKSSDIVLFVVDSTQRITNEDIAIFEKIKDKKVILVINKIDKSKNEIILEKLFLDMPTVKVSAKSIYENKNIDVLLDTILRETVNVDQSGGIIVKERHFEHLSKAKECLLDALDAINNGVTYDCIILDLNNAIKHIRDIEGNEVATEVIDKIFDSFCVGK